MSMRASAARYARALLDITITESDPVAAERDLAAFVDLVRSHPDLQRTLANSWSAASPRLQSASFCCCWPHGAGSSSCPIFSTFTASG